MRWGRRPSPSFASTIEEGGGDASEQPLSPYLEVNPRESGNCGEIVGRATQKITPG
jgi:hypothetical protein